MRGFAITDGCCSERLKQEAVAGRPLVRRVHHSTAPHNGIRSAVISSKRRYSAMTRECSLGRLKRDLSVAWSLGANGTGEGWILPARQARRVMASGVSATALSSDLGSLLRRRGASVNELTDAQDQVATIRERNA